ncbi:hypothetical protein V8F06_008366 [Rhypophila decipiens]
MSSSTAEKRESELVKVFENIGSIAGAEVMLNGSRRISEKLVVRMLDQIGLTKETTKRFKLFDNACGIGSTNFEIHRRIRPDVLEQSSILLGDFAEGLIPLTTAVAKEEGWVNTVVKRVDGQSTGLPSGEFTHVTTNIGFQVIPDSRAALDEAVRILKPGGHLAFTTWERIPGWALEVQNAFATFPFEAPFSFSVQTTKYGEWGNINWIRHELQHRLELEDVQVEAFAFTSHVDNVDYFMNTFGPMVDWVVKSNWSEELQAQHGREEYRGLLKEYLVGRYGGGGWDLSWLGIVSSGRVASSAS